MAQDTPERRLSDFFSQQLASPAIPNPNTIGQLNSAISDPELSFITAQKASLKAKIGVLGLFQQEVQGMIDNIDKSDVVLVLTDVVTLGGGDEGQAYQLITQYLELTAKQRERENKAFAVIPVRVTATQLTGYLGKLQCFPRYGKSISEKTHESIGLTEVASAIRDLYDRGFTNNSASLSVVCSPKSHDMFAKVTGHLLASGVVDNKYYHSGFQLLTNATQQKVLDDKDPISLDIDRRIAQMYAANPGGDLLEYAKIALKENPDTAGIIENIDNSDIVLLGMHADLLGTRRYRLIEMYLKHVAEQKTVANKPFTIIPVYLGVCAPDSWVNVYGSLPGGFDKDNPTIKPTIETSKNKEKTLADCAEGITRIVERFVRSGGNRQLQCFPLYPVSQMGAIDKFISHLQVAHLVGNSQETVATAPIKIVQTEQVQAIKSQSTIGDKNKLMHFANEMIAKLPDADVILSMVDAETLATQQFDTFCTYVADLKHNQTIGLYSVLVSELSSRDKLNEHKVLSPYGEYLRTGNIDVVLSNIVTNLKRQVGETPPRSIIIVASEANRSFADSLNVHLAAYKRMNNIVVDFLYI